ncbi:MAG: thioredoxin family protein [Acidimicrobiia bacterium]|nr:thioredoxin family protein [Acidimicrobiia bacterium]
MDTKLPVRPTVVQVTAPWCGECRAMRPTIEAVADHHPDVQFLVIDASADPASVAALGVNGIPTVIGYSRGQEVLRSTGRRTRAELESMFEAVTADDAPMPVLGKGDLMLRVGAGAALITLGLVSGPVWPLVGIGTVVGLLGFRPLGNRTR